MEKPDFNISLRALEPSDVELLYDWENNREVWSISNTLKPFSKYILTKYIESSHLDIYEAKQIRMMIDLGEREEKRTIGSVDLYDFDPYHLRAGIGILIAEEKDRNKGYASQALREIIEYAFNVLKIKQLFCGIAVSNEASLKLFKKAGFSISGVKKQWLKTMDDYEDEIFLQLINDSF